MGEGPIFGIETKKVKFCCKASILDQFSEVAKVSPSPGYGFAKP